MVNHRPHTVCNRKMIRDTDTIITKFHLQESIQLLEIDTLLQRFVAGCTQYVKDHFIQQCPLMNISIVQNIPQGSCCLRYILSRRDDWFRHIRFDSHLPLKMTQSTFRTDRITLGIFHQFVITDMRFIGSFIFFRFLRSCFRSYRISFQIIPGFRQFQITACLIQTSLHRFIKLFTARSHHFFNIAYLQEQQAKK